MVIKKAVKTTKPVKKLTKVITPVVDDLDDKVLASIPAETLEADEKGPEKYYETVGRRKEAIARVRLFTKKSTDVAGEEKALVVVNQKSYIDYFTDVNLQHVV